MKFGLRIVIIVGAVIVLVLTAGSVVNSAGRRKWQGVGRYTIIRVDTGILLESIDAKSNRGIKVKIPGDVEVETLKQRGQWKPKSLTALSEKYGSKWMGDSIADYLGIAYTGLWDDLGLWDKFTWWVLAGQVKWSEYDLGDTGLLEDKQLADNQKVLGVSELWNRKSRELFYASDLAGFDGEIRVWNTTEYPGLAGKAAAVLESAGLRVIQVGKADREEGVCLVKSDSGKGNVKLVKWIAQVLSCVVKDTQGEGNFIDVYLGKDFEKRYTL